MKIRIIVLKITVSQRGCQSKTVSFALAVTPVCRFHNLDYQSVDVMNKRNKSSSLATVVTHYKH